MNQGKFSKHFDLFDKLIYQIKFFKKKKTIFYQAILVILLYLNNYRHFKCSVLFIILFLVIIQLSNYW